MSTESLETLTRTYAAWRAGRPEEALAWLDPEVVWTAIEDAPDAGTYRGPDGVLTYATRGPHARQQRNVGGAALRR